MPHDADVKTSPVALFETLVQRLTERTRAEGFVIAPFSRKRVFADLPEPQQQRVLWQLGLLTEICESLAGRGVSLRNASEFFREFFERTGYEPPPDLLSRLQPDQFIDVYDDSHRIVVASLKFVSTVSYSLEELYCRPWMELFSRDNQAVHQMLYDLALAVMAGEHTEIVPTNHVPRHIVWETDSPLRMAGYMIPRFFAPLRKDGRVAGYLCVNEGEPLVNSAAERKTWAERK